MSHELRTPLNAIIGFSEILAEKMFGDVNDKQIEYLQDILESGTASPVLINDIVNLSAHSSSRRKLARLNQCGGQAIPSAPKSPKTYRSQVLVAARVLLGWNPCSKGE
jgi:signal transduction histidine kinase